MNWTDGRLRRIENSYGLQLAQIGVKCTSMVSVIVRSILMVRPITLSFRHHAGRGYNGAGYDRKDWSIGNIFCQHLLDRGLRSLGWG